MTGENKYIRWFETLSSRDVPLVGGKNASLGEKARETVRRKFLLTRYLEQYLDLFNSFETVYRLKKKSD